ncbi:MAG: hypothetical protein QXL67_03295 [Candidatus Bathyarchaeia archaeon]
MSVEELWIILERFKDSCKAKGWDVEKSIDLIKRGDEYHNFLFTKEIRPSTFRRIGVYAKSVVKERELYRVVELTYNAWVCSKPVPESVWSILEEKPEMLSRNAIYDFSELATSGVCRKLNETSSVVFREFENFLSEELKCKLESARSRILKTMNRN